eukprot:GHVS01038927.1.p5 GENE.GHVS01038927.1~~GHVS01038927.1.p5  ORF type:complete len:115 (+),score=17.62 GHVS01038927.1:126-470(+)
MSRTTDESKSSQKEEDEDNVKLISSDGTEFVIAKSIAFESDVIKNMCQGSHFVEGRNKEVRFSNITAALLEKVIDYLEYKHKHEHTQDGAALPEFPIPSDMALDLLLTANYLGI